MTKNITLAIDELVLAEARVVAAKHGTTVNALVRSYLEDVARKAEDNDVTAVALRALFEQTDSVFEKRAAGRRRTAEAQPSEECSALEEDNGASAEAQDLPPLSSHQSKVKIVEEGSRRYADNPLSKEAIHDRDYARALNYLENRARLLKRIDETQGDMGKQRWSREALYER